MPGLTIFSILLALALGREVDAGDRGSDRFEWDYVPFIDRDQQDREKIYRAWRVLLPLWAGYIEAVTFFGLAGCF
jgi:hypothetical protein